MTRVVVVGNGMAGGQLVGELVARGVRDVTIIGDEPRPAYNRVLLSRVLAGAHDAEEVALRPAGWYAANGVTLRTGVRVESIDRDRREVLATSGERFGYDRLILATGSRPSMPPVRGIIDAEGAMNPGVFSFRTLGDCEQILAAARPGMRAVVIGGGLLGLEAAHGLHQRGLAVEVVHQGPHLMEKQLDEGAAAVLQRRMSQLGVPAYIETRAVAIVPGGEIGVRGVRLDDQYLLECDLVVFACGITPAVTLARAAGLDVHRGIVVDDQLATSDPDISALGECAEHDGVVSGYVQAAWDQAEVLAAVVAGAPTSGYRGSRQVTRLRAMGVEVAAMGETTAIADATTHVLRLSDPLRGTYKLAVVRDGVLVGALLLGDLATVATLTRAYDRRTPLPADRMHLLFQEGKVA